MGTPRGKGKGKDTPTPDSPKTDNSALTKDNGRNSGNKLEIDGSGKTGKNLLTPALTVDVKISDHGFHDGGSSDPGTVDSSLENDGEEVQSQMAMVQIMPSHMSGQFISQQQMNHPMQSGGIAFPSIEKVVEFRYDLVSMTQFQEHQIPSLASYTCFNLAPSNRQVFVVVESCSHYYSQPSCMYIAGEWVPTTILIPVAQHICISLDDGIKRYEEVIKVDLLKVAHPSEPHVGFLTSIEHRVVRGNPSHRPRFGDILRKSLMESMRQLSDMQFELLVSRPTGRNVTMDCRLTSFFNESRPGSPYELHVNPLIQHVPQHLEVPLAGVRYKLAGVFHRPFVGYASLLLSRADIQIFETLALNVYTNDRKIVAVAFDSAMVRIVGNPDGSSGVSLIDAASYSEFGPICSGLNVLSHNPRVPHSYHPFCNLSQNVIFNRALNPFHNFTFSPPVSIPGHPPPSFFPAPYGYPFGCHMLSGLVQPFVQQPLYLPIPFPPPVDCMDQHQQIPQDNHSHSDFEYRTPILSPREKKTTGKDSTTKLNPNAKDFYPSGYHHSLVATPFPLQNGPEEINISDLQTESDDQVILSSSMPCPPLSVDELEVLQIHGPPAEKSCSSEISMLVNRASGGFLNQSDSRCSLYDPDTSVEIRSFVTQNEYSWSEQVENEEKTDNQAPRYDNRGGKIFRGGGYRGSGGYRSNQQEEWGGRGGNKYSNYRWNSRQHSRQDSGEPVDSNSQDVRLGHGFNNRTNFNQTRPTGGGQFENDRGNWRYGRPRGGRGRGSYGYPRHGDYDQDYRRGYGNSNQNRNSGDWWSDPRPSQGETNVQKTGFCQEPRPESEPETPEVNHRGSSDSDDIPDGNRREKMPVSYAAAARTNVPEDQVQVPTKAQIFTATPTVKAESVKSHDDHENDFGHHNDGYKDSSPRRGYHNNAYKTVHRSEYRPTSADNKPNDNNTGFRPHSQNQTEYSQGEYNDQRQGVPFRKNYYNKYPQRETWNSEAGYSGETENTADTRSGTTSTYTPRGGRFQNYNNRYQRNFPVGKYSRRGSGRTPHNQDVPILTDFPPLGSASSKPQRDAKEPVKPTKASSRGTVKGRGKKFGNHHKDGSGSSDDFGKCDNYLSDVIPNENRPNRSQMSLKIEKPEVVESDDGEHQDEDKEESEFDEIHDRFQTQSEEDDSKVELKQEWVERQTYYGEKAIDNDREDPKDAQGDGFFHPEIGKDCGEKGEMNLKVIEKQREKTVITPVFKDSIENDVRVEGKNECQTDAEGGGEPWE